MVISCSDRKKVIYVFFIAVNTCTRIVYTCFFWIINKNYSFIHVQNKCICFTRFWIYWVLLKTLLLYNPSRNLNENYVYIIYFTKKQKFLQRGRTIELNRILYIINTTIKIRIFKIILNNQYYFKAQPVMCIVRCFYRKQNSW